MSRAGEVVRSSKDKFDLFPRQGLTHVRSLSEDLNLRHQDIKTNQEKASSRTSSLKSRRGFAASVAQADRGSAVDLA